MVKNNLHGRFEHLAKSRSFLWIRSTSCIFTFHLESGSIFMFSQYTRLLHLIKNKFFYDVCCLISLSEIVVCLSQNS